jgi:hypothetical protein
LAADARRPRREGRTARKLYAQLRAQGFPRSYGRITEFTRAWRTEQGAVSARAAYVLLSFVWGEAFPSVATALTVASAPLADPHRYDTLREEEATRSSPTSNACG